MKAIGWILVGVLIGVILFAWIMLTLASRAVSQIEEKYERPRFSHPPMDLRLKRDPCDGCSRVQECEGVDRDNCEVAKGD